MCQKMLIRIKVISGYLKRSTVNKHSDIGYRISPVVNHLLQTTGIDLTYGGGIRELTQFQEHFTDYHIVVYGALNCEDEIFDGQTESEKRICCMTRRHVIMT